MGTRQDPWEILSSSSPEPELSPSSSSYDNTTSPPAHLPFRPTRPVYNRLNRSHGLAPALQQRRPPSVVIQRVVRPSRPSHHVTHVAEEAANKSIAIFVNRIDDSGMLVQVR